MPLSWGVVSLPPKKDDEDSVAMPSVAIDWPDLPVEPVVEIAEDVIFHYPGAEGKLLVG